VQFNRQNHLKNLRTCRHPSTRTYANAYALVDSAHICTRCDYVTTKKHSAYAFAYTFTYTYTRNLKVPNNYLL